MQFDLSFQFYSQLILTQIIVDFSMPEIIGKHLLSLIVAHPKLLLGNNRGTTSFSNSRKYFFYKLSSLAALLLSHHFVIGKLLNLLINDILFSIRHSSLLLFVEVSLLEATFLSIPTMVQEAVNVLSGVLELMICFKNL